MKRVALLVAGFLLVPGAAEATPIHDHAVRASGPHSTARGSALYLTMPEAKGQIRARARRDARRDGARLEYIEISDCFRYSARRIGCYVYREGSDDVVCEGDMQVIEFQTFYRTRGIDTSCY